MKTSDFNHQLAGLQKDLSCFAYTLSLDNDQSQDLVQETMLKAILNKGKFTPETNLRAWTFTIMKNIFINQYHKKKKTVIDTSENYFLFDMEGSKRSASPDSIYAAKEIKSMVNDLKEDHRMPFEMHLKGYKYREIAEKLNISVGNVKIRIYFARQSLMSKISRN